MATINPAYASGTVSSSGTPSSVGPSSGTLQYYGTTSGYLCYHDKSTVGSSEEAVAKAEAQANKYSTTGFTKMGSGTYDGKQYSYCRGKDSNSNVYSAAQYVCQAGSGNTQPWQMCTGMPNSRNNPNECCPCGYSYDAAQRTCVLSNTTGCSATCPANSTLSGSTCTCNDPFVPDTAKTSCVQPTEDLTITLPGLEDTVTVTLGQTLSTYAKVTKSDGSAKSGVQVALILTVVPELQGQLPSTYTGTLSANTVSIGSTIYRGETGTDGRLNFVFTAPQAGGTHTIYAVCMSPSCTNYAEEKIKVPGCPVPELADLEDLSKLLDKTQDVVNLTKALENKMDGYSLLLPETRNAEQCLAERVRTVLGPPSKSGYTLTSTIRTPAYQKHLREVWDKFKELQLKINKDQSIEQRCESLIARIEGEMGFRFGQDPTDPNTACDGALGRAHCIRFQPAGHDPKHVKKLAFDIPPATVRAYSLQLMRRRPPSTVQKEANACNLTWGGSFRPKADPVHFQCCVQ